MHKSLSPIGKTEYTKLLRGVYLLAIVCAILINSGVIIASQISYGLVLLTALLLPPKKIVVLIFSLIPFIRLFLLSKGFITLLPLLEVIFICKYVIRRRLKLQESTCISLALLGMLVGYSLFVELININNIKNSIQFALKTIVMCIMIEACCKELRVQCFRCLCISTLFTSIAGIMLPNTANYTAIYFSVYNTRFQGLTSDAGTFGQLSVCALACAIYLFYISANKYKGLKLGVFISIIFYFIIKSGTRACLMAIVFIYGVCVLKMMRSRKNVRILGVVMAVISIIVLPVALNILFNVIAGNRAGVSVTEDSRFKIWHDYFELWHSQWKVLTFGVGLDSCNAFAHNIGIGNPHNFIIEKVTECGIVGLTIAVPLFVRIFKRKKMGILALSNLPFYTLWVTMLVYGSAGSELLYFLLALIDRKDSIDVK